jgi:hypothetical protein
MGLFDAIFGEITPKNREQLLDSCEKKIAIRDYEKAISLAMKYIKHGIRSTSRTLEQKEQKDLDMGCSYYIITKALFNNFKEYPATRIYKYFKLFFMAHFYSGSVFQEYPEDSEYYSYLKKIDSFYDDLYKICCDNPDLKKADIDANEEIIEIRRVAELESMGLKDWI